MAIEVRISGTTYKAADDFIIKQQAGAVSMSTVSVLNGSNPIPQPLQSAQILIDGAPVFYGLIASVQDPRRSTGYEPARYTLEIQSIETVLNFRMAKRNWYNKRVDEIVTDIFTDYLAEEGITLGGISTTTVQISAYRKNHSKISEILDELAEKVDGASYYIAPDKKFYFLVRDDFTAIEAPDRVTNMSRSRSYGDLRTVQTVKGASAGILATWTNTALKAAIAALSGTSGKIEAIRDDSTIRNPTAAATEAADTGARHAENEQTIRCEVEGIAGTDLYTLWDIAPSRTVEGETVPTKWPAEYEGEYVVIERTITGAGGKIQTSLTLRNRNYFARYGYTVRSIAAGNALNNDRLGEEFSQDRLTPAKKLVALRNFLEAHDDVTSLDAQADALGILTEKAALDAAYQAIGTYLNAGDPWDGISLPAWLTDEAMTITEELIGTEYDAIWLNFNLKKNAIREKIAFVTSASNNAYAEAQAALAQTTAQAYADGIVTAAEQAAIDHADDVADAARLAAIAAAALDATSKATAAQTAAEAYTRSATKYLTALTTQGDFQGQLGLFAGRIYRWTGAIWDPQDAIIPTDTPALYLSFDDVPDIPDDPAGTTYRSNWATSVDGWLPNYGTSSVNYQDGALVFSGNGVSSEIAVYKPSVQLNGKIYIIKIRYDPDLEGINYYTGTSTYGLTLHRVGEYYIAVATCTTNGYDNATLYFLYTTAAIAATKTITMLDAYVGTGAYLAPAIDNSGGGRHGVNSGAIPVSGVSGKAVRFNGSKVINLGNGAGNMGASSFTLSAWVKGAPSGFTVFKRGSGYSNGFGIRGLSAYFISANPNNELYASFGSSFPSGWNSLVAVYDRVSHVMKAYLNGVLVSSTSLAGYTNPIDNFHPLIIGGTEWGSEMSSADIDEVSIFPRALTDSEIRGLYLAKSLPKLYSLSDYQLDQMASDSVITPQEKGQVSTEWTRINGNGSTTGSYWTAKAEASALSVSYTAAEAARNALYAYLYTSPGVLANMDVPTAITPATWRGLWQAYDDAEVALLNAIAAKRAANAEAAATAAAALDATAKANAAKLYADGLSSTLQTQLDRAIVYYTQIGDPSTDWTTQSSRNEHIGDYWRISSIATWRQWSGSAWTDITDPVAQAAATAAQSTANVKSTLWATLAIAQGHAVAGDLFLGASLLYRCTVAGASITLENSTRLTPKRYADVADSTARAALTGMILGDRVYQLDTLQWYVYTTSWITDGPALASVPATYAPRFLGRYNASHPGTVHPGDWWVVYDTDDSLIQRGVYYSNAGSSTRISAVSGETGYTTDQTLLSKLSSAMPEVAWAEKNGFGTASDYGISMYFESFGAVTAFILSLFANEVTISPNGHIKSANYSEDEDEIPTAGYMLDALNQVIKSYGSIFRNTVIKTAQIEDASFSGIIQSDALDTQQEILSTWTASGTFYGYDIKEYFGLVAEQEYSCLATTFYGKTPSKIKYYKTGIKNITQAYAVKVTFTDASTLDLYEGVSYSSSTYSGTIQIGQYALALQNCYAGSYLLTSKTTPSAARTTSATKVIEFTFARKGSVNIKMAAGASVTPGSTSNFSSYTLNARIYKDGAAYGTSRSVTVPAYTWDTETGTGSGGAASGSWTEDVTGITAGTKVQIYIWVSAVRTGALQSASMDIRIAQEGFSEL